MFFQNTNQEEGEAEVGVTRGIFADCFEKSRRKIEKDRRKLWMICFCFHLWFFSWFECRDYLCRDRALEAVSAKNDSSPRRRMKTFHFAKSFTRILDFVPNGLIELLISCQMAY